MAAPSKSDPSFGSPGKPSHATGQRGSYTSALLDRSSSLREGMDNPMLSALPNMSRSSLAVSQHDVTNFLNCLRFDSRPLTEELSVLRQTDHKRSITSALEASRDDAPSTSSKGKILPSSLANELKQIKGVTRESCHKAREHTKLFIDASSTFNKFFPSIPSRKRSRLDALSSSRSNLPVSSDRSVLGSSTNRNGSQNHATTYGFDIQQQKLEERIKSSGPSKRTRTSVVDAKMDIQPTALSRSSGTADKDGEVPRPMNNGAVQGDDKALSVGVDGWEKLKLKRKRSVIKPDVGPGTTSNKPNEGYREGKHGLQQRLVADGRSRLNDAHGFRSGVANGAIEVGKTDGISQQTGLGIRSFSRTEQDSNALSNDRRDRPGGSDKERVNIRVVNKVNARDDFRSVSPTSNMKVHASARAPRSGSAMVPKLSPVVHRAAAPDDWEFSHCTNKHPAAVGANNRKGTLTTRSSSPPVAHWAGPRQTKSSRTARRTNFVPVNSNNDETPTLDVTSDVNVNESGLGSTRHLHSSSQHIKFKGDHFSSVALSESEESAAADNKSMDKTRKSDEIDEKVGLDVQKVRAQVSSSRKNKMVNGEDLGDGIRRPGRTGRGLTSTRVPVPVVGDGTAKQLRSARLNLDKTESKAGRSHPRKLSDRKAFSRQKHMPINASMDVLVGSDNGHELLAAANAAMDSSHTFSSSFWRDMDPFFRFISDSDIDYLKQQGGLGSISSTPASASLDDGGCGTGLDGSETNECWGLMAFAPDTKRRKPLPAQKEIPLTQRLIAALIPEEESEEFYCRGNDNSKFDAHGTGYELDGDLESSGLGHEKTVSGCNASNGCMPTANGAILLKAEPNGHENEMAAIPKSGPFLHGLHPDQSFIPNMTCSEFQYDEMSIDERVLLELQSIGIFPDPLPGVEPTEEEEISENISKLEDMFRGQVSKNKSLLSELLKLASEEKKHQEKEFECCALDKLIKMAYDKYMSCRGPNASGGKSSSSKMAKQAALAFVKRTLEHCREFESTGKSCFSDSFFMDLLRTSHLNDAKPVNKTAVSESPKSYLNSCAHPMDARVSAFSDMQRNPSLASVDSHGLYSSVAPLPVNHLPEQPIVEEDIWSNRVKKREVLLDDVGGTAGTSGIAFGIGASLSTSTKGKRSERDREGKGHRELSSRNGTARIGRPALPNIRGERKSRSKPKQKTAQLSVSVNGLCKIPEPSKPAVFSVPKSSEKEEDDFGLDLSDSPGAAGLSSMQLPEMGVLGDQVQDLGSWLNIDDDGLQDNDIMGLEIPMDDLSDLNMIV